MADILTTMPEEILLEILEQVQDQASLYRFMQCSRATYDTTLPLLYRDVDIVHEKHPNNIPYYYQSLYNFTCQILRSHQRASLVRSFAICGLRCSHWEYTTPPRYAAYPPRVVIDDGIQEAVRRARDSIEDETDWWSDIYSRSPRCIDALLAILLPSLPRLEELVTGFAFTRKYCIRMLVNVVERSGQFFPVTALERLEHVIIPECAFDHGCPDCGIRSNELAFLLRLPSIKSLTAWVGEPEDERQNALADETVETNVSGPSDRVTVEHASSTMNTIDFVGLFPLWAEVRNAVILSRNLKSLEIHWIYDLFTHRGSANSHVEKLCAAIMPASHTLETLSLTHIGLEAVRAQLRRDHSGHRHVQLTDFLRLREVRLDMFFVFNGGELFNPFSEIRREDCELLASLLPIKIEVFRIVHYLGENRLLILENALNVAKQMECGRFDRLELLFLEERDEDGGLTSENGEK